jgi:hypothetical protein
MSDVYEPSILHQRAVYWTPDGGTDDYGKPSYSTPVEIKCRWHDEINQVLDAAGNTVTTRSKVFVDRDLALDGILRLGDLTTLTDPTKPFSNGNAWRIQNLSKIPDENAKKWVRTVFL